MNRDGMMLMLDYSYWATDRVLAAAEKATEDELHAVSPASGQSIHSTLVHMMDAERIWRLRCQGASPSTLASPADYPTLAELLAVWADERSALRAYVAGLTDSELADAKRYRNTKGDEFAQTLWQILAHVCNHATQHRAEAALLLTELGYSPGDVDLMLYLRQKAQAGV